MAELEEHGYHSFRSSTMVWEEIGISLARWGGKVDELARAGLPDQMADLLKETMRCTGSREKRMLCSRWSAHGSDMCRHTFFLRFQTFLSDRDASCRDAILGLNWVVALLPSEACSTGGLVRRPAWPVSEQAFRTYMELDSDIRFRREVQAGGAGRAKPRGPRLQERP